MKKFEYPAMDIEELKIMDVIATSDGCEDYCDYNCKWDSGERSVLRIFG